MIKSSVICDHCGKMNEQEFVSIHTAKNPKTSRFVVHINKTMERQRSLTGRMDFCNLACLTAFFTELFKELQPKE